MRTLFDSVIRQTRPIVRPSSAMPTISNLPSFGQGFVVRMFGHVVKAIPNQGLYFAYPAHALFLCIMLQVNRAPIMVGCMGAIIPYWGWGDGEMGNYEL
jgi:hypothetical protein